MQTPKKIKQGQNQHTKHSLESWWNTAVPSVQQEMKEARRQHYMAVRVPQPEQVCKQLWDGYRENKTIGTASGKKLVDEFKRRGHCNFRQHVQRSHKHAGSKQQLGHPERQILLPEVDSREPMVCAIGAVIKKKNPLQATCTMNELCRTMQRQVRMGKCRPEGVQQILGSGLGR